MTNYLDIGVFNDYHRFTERPLYRFFPEDTSFTPLSVLTGDNIPDQLQVQRALALAYAFNEERCAGLDALLQTNCEDVCFQLYALLSCNVQEMKDYILFSQRSSLDELWVVATAIHADKILTVDMFYGSHNTDTPESDFFEKQCATRQEQMLFRSESIYVLQKKAREFIFKDKSLLSSPQFKCISTLGDNSSKEELSRMWCSCLNGCITEYSRPARFFWSWGITFIRLLQSIRKANNMRYYHLLTPVLFDKCSAWTDNEKELLLEMNSIPVYNQIEHFSNYKWAYETLRDRVDITAFSVSVTYRTAIARLQLLRPEDRRMAIALSFAATGKISETIRAAFPKETSGIFKTYQKSLQKLWESMLPSIPYKYDKAFIKAYLFNLDDLSAAIQYIDEDTLPIFCRQLDNCIINNAVESWCINTNKYYLLCEYCEYFDSTMRENICAQASMIAIGRHPELPADASTEGIALPLQPYAAKYDYHFKSLTQKQQEFLAKAVTLSDKYPETRLISFTKLCSKKCDNPMVLKFALKYGKRYLPQIIHYFVDLRGAELLFDENIVCNKEYIFAARGQTLEEAKYFRGRVFKRTRPLNQEFNDKTLDFFEWCGTDEYNVVIPETVNDSDFGIIFVEQCLKIGGCNWEIWSQELLDNFYFMKYFTTECTTIPAEVIREISCSNDMQNMTANLKRHPINWYQKFENYSELLFYDFDWNDAAVAIRDEIFKAMVSTKTQLFIQSCYDSGYASAINLVQQL